MEIVWYGKQVSMGLSKVPKSTKKHDRKKNKVDGCELE